MSPVLSPSSQSEQQLEAQVVLASFNGTTWTSAMAWLSNMLEKGLQRTAVTFGTAISVHDPWCSNYMLERMHYRHHGMTGAASWKTFASRLCVLHFAIMCPSCGQFTGAILCFDLGAVQSQHMFRCDTATAPIQLCHSHPYDKPMLHPGCKRWLSNWAACLGAISTVCRAGEPA